jgi:2-keto-4-pentenoate hydratase
MLARELISVHEAPREVPRFSQTHPGLTAEAGYAAAKALHEHRAEDNRAVVPLDGLINPRIEPEICFGLRAVPRGDNLLECIEWMAHSIEIVQCHHAGWKLALPDATADNGLHGRLILGTPARLPADVEAKLPALQVELYRGEGLVDRGVGANVLDSPFKALAHLVALLSEQAGAPSLEAGELITTGVITDAHPVKAGETWSTRVVGLALPGLKIEFA